MTTPETIAAIRGQIDELQQWFAAKPCGWRESATAGQLQQWADREREEAYLVERLECLTSEPDTVVMTSSELMGLGLL